MSAGSKFGMFRFFVYGQKAPEWLQKVSPGTAKCTFAYALAVAWKWRGEYWVTPLLPIGKALFFIDTKGEAVSVTGGPTNMYLWHTRTMYLLGRALKWFIIAPK